jgi:hypothetical protein
MTIQTEKATEKIAVPMADTSEMYDIISSPFRTKF